MNLPAGFGMISINNDNTFECQSKYIDFKTNPIYNIKVIMQWLIIILILKHRLIRSG